MWGTLLFGGVAGLLQKCPQVQPRLPIAEHHLWSPSPLEGSCVCFGVFHQERVSMSALCGLRAPGFTFSAFPTQVPPPFFFFSFYFKKPWVLLWGRREPACDQHVGSFCSQPSWEG